MQKKRVSTVAQTATPAFGFHSWRFAGVLAAEKWANCCRAADAHTKEPAAVNLLSLR